MNRMKSWTGPVLWIAVALVSCDDLRDAGPAATEEANKEVVRQFVAAMNTRDLDALDDLVVPDLVRESPSTPDVDVRSLEELKAFLRQNFEAFPDERQEIRRLVAEEDEVALLAVYSGTQTGPMGPFPASGRRVDLEFAAFLTIEEGRIAHIRVVWDNLSMLTALGHLPGGPGGQGTPEGT